MNLQEERDRFPLMARRAIGTRTPYTCPECNGSLWQIGKDEPLRFHCHIGHSFTANVFLAEQTQKVENALWSSVRTMEKKVTFSRQMTERMRTYHLQTAAAKYEDHAKHLDAEVSLIQGTILDGFAAKRAVAEVEDKQPELL